MLQAVSALLPVGGEIDFCPLRWCLLTGTDCLAYAEQYRVNSSDAEVALLTNRRYWRPLLNYTSVSQHCGPSLSSFGMTLWAIRCYTSLRRRN